MYKKIRKSKKGMEIGKLFIYILALFIMAIVLFYSTKWIYGIFDKKCEADSALFKSELNENINVAARNKNNVYYPKIATPCDAEKICFGDFDYFDDTNDASIRSGISECVTSSGSILDELRCNALVVGKQNVFVVPKKAVIGNPVKNELISLGGAKVLCFDVKQGNLEIKVTGIGKKASIEMPESIS
tara:strand:+ start:58 stop:618 length:561 start_codon:yes stop_codon:yes gene_type:complete